MGNLWLIYAILGWLDQRFKTDRTQKTSMICRCIIIANMYEWHGAQIQTTHTVLHEFPDGFLRIYFTPFLSFSLSSCWLFCRQWYTTHVHTATWSHRWVCLNTGSNACGVHQFLHSKHVIMHHPRREGQAGFEASRWRVESYCTPYRIR